MSEMVRFDIIFDSVATSALLKAIARFEAAACTLHRALASRVSGRVVTEDDLSDSVSSNLLIVYIEEQEETAFKEAIQPILKLYDASAFSSPCSPILT